MKKFIVITIAAFFAALGTAPAHAQTPPSTSIPGTPELCVEADTRPPNVDCSPGLPPDLYPPAVAPPTTTIPPVVAPPTTTIPPVLPATGSSGTSGMLQLGGLLVTGGLLVFIAARRRSAATNPA